MRKQVEEMAFQNNVRQRVLSDGGFKFHEGVSNSSMTLEFNNLAVAVLLLDTRMK